MKIVGLSGKKQAGKNTICNYLFGEYLVQKGLVDRFTISDKGELCLGQELEHPNLVYSFGDSLKNICAYMFDISSDKLWGDNTDKDSLTHIKWEDVPLFSAKDVFSLKNNLSVKEGYMTAREFMQILGTNVFRKIYDHVWVNQLIKQLEMDNPEVAFICDVRFPNEVEAIEAIGGKVVRLTRNPFNCDHEGEVALDSHNFDLVIDNAQMDIPTQNYEAYKLLKDYLYT